MQQNRLIIYCLISCIFFIFYNQVEAKYNGGIKCTADGFDFKNQEQIFFELIKKKEDREYLNDIVQRLSIKIEEVNTKQQSGERLLEALDSRKIAFDKSFNEWKELRSELKQRYNQLSYSETIKMRELISQKESDVRLKGANYDSSVEELNVLSTEIKNLAEEIKNIKENFVNKINQIEQERRSSVGQYSAKSLWDYLNKGEFLQDICKPI